MWAFNSAPISALIDHTLSGFNRDSWRTAALLSLYRIKFMPQCQDEVRILSGRTQKLKVAKRCWNSDMSITLCISITNNVKTCQKKINERAQTAKFSVLCRLRQELFAENPKRRKLLERQLKYKIFKSEERTNRR